jgi:hypothetical protein
MQEICHRPPYRSHGVIEHQQGGRLKGGVEARQSGGCELHEGLPIELLALGFTAKADISD